MWSCDPGRFSHTCWAINNPPKEQQISYISFYVVTDVATIGIFVVTWLLVVNLCVHMTLKIVWLFAYSFVVTLSSATQPLIYLGSHKVFRRVRPRSQYDENAWHTLDATLKHKDDGLNYYPCFTYTVLDMSDHTCHKFIMEIVFMIFIQKPINAW